MIRQDIRKNFCVYTCIYGDHYTLPNVMQYENVRYICFTDNKNLNSNGWEIRQSIPVFKLDPVRSARVIKILPHKFLKEFKLSLYIDPSVQLIGNPINFFNFLINNCVIGTIEHSFRNTVEDEFYEVFHQNLDEVNILEQQLKSQISENLDNIKLKPIWTGIIARRHLDPICQDAMELWLYKVLRYSRRDQLSVSEIFDGIKSHVNFNQLDNHKSQFHLWPVAGYSRTKKYSEYINLIPALLNDLKKQSIIDGKDKEIVNLTQVTQAKEQEIVNLTQVTQAKEQEIVNLTQVTQAKEQEIVNLTQVTQAKEQEINEILNSTCWKITSPFRIVYDLFKKIKIK